MKILFVNVCVRKDSRTKRLADYLLERMEGEVTELCLEQENLQPLSGALLHKREQLISGGMYQDSMFRYARQFADADVVVIAAPYWDLSYPSLLKIYLEAITVPGLTFRYVDGVPEGLCNAKKLIYVTTAGGPIMVDFGYSYVKKLAESFFCIPETACYKAENLDVIGMDVEALLRQAEKEIGEKNG